MKKWEYKVVKLEYNTSVGGQERELESLGKLGWELVAVSILETYPVYYLKREKE